MKGKTWPSQQPSNPTSKKKNSKLIKTIEVNEKQKEKLKERNSSTAYNSIL